jgi:hypothetical protein
MSISLILTIGLGIFLAFRSIAGACQYGCRWLSASLPILFLWLAQAKAQYFRMKVFVFGAWGCCCSFFFVGRHVHYPSPIGT